MRARLTLVAVLAMALSATAQAAAPRDKSDNWSGYVAVGSVFKTIRAHWVQPGAQCFGRSSGETSSSFWVGLGGELRSSYKLEQTGTEADCLSNGTPEYFAWYEVWPAQNVAIDFAIFPGDKISASVGLGPESVTFVLTDVTRHEHFARSFQISEPDGTSAEWIAEAPSYSENGRHRIDPLTDFGSVRFTNASATSAHGQTGSISSPAWHQKAINFLSGHVDPKNPLSGILETADSAHGFPSALTRGGTSFRVVWRRGLSKGSTAPAGSA